MWPEGSASPGSAGAVGERLAETPEVGAGPGEVPTGESATGEGEALGSEAYLAALSSLAGMGPARLERLLGRWGPEEAWEVLVAGSLAEVTGVARVGEQVGRRWVSDARRADPAQIHLRHSTAGVTVRRRGAAGYPERLGGDPEPPAVLFSQGELELLEHPTVTIVGTRRCTRYGADAAFDLGKAAAAHGVAVISGLAVGIDAAAHAGALAADGVPPVGVVGSGLDRIYPRENAVLWRIVAQRGLLLSEAPLGTAPERWRFPARNRIMAALSDACVVVESHVDGGALLTATEAAQRSRAVAAVPGPIRSPASAGTNRLIAEGAGVLCDVEDLLVLLDISRTTLPLQDVPADPAGSAPVSDAGAVAILDAFDWMPATLEMLASRTGLDLGELAWHLENLSASGLLARRGLWYERSGEAPVAAGRAG